MSPASYPGEPKPPYYGDVHTPLGHGLADEDWEKEQYGQMGYIIMSGIMSLPSLLLFRGYRGLQGKLGQYNPKNRPSFPSERDEPGKYVDVGFNILRNIMSGGGNVFATFQSMYDPNAPRIGTRHPPQLAYNYPGSAVDTRYVDYDSITYDEMIDHMIEQWWFKKLSPEEKDAVIEGMSSSHARHRWIRSKSYYRRKRLWWY